MTTLLRAAVLGTVLGGGWGIWESWPQPQARLATPVLAQPCADAEAELLPRFPLAHPVDPVVPLNRTGPEPAPPRTSPSPPRERPVPPPPSTTAGLPEPLAQALQRFERGTALYRAFLTEEGRSMEMGIEAREVLEEARDALDEMAPRYPEHGHRIQAALQTCVSYLAFLYHNTR